MADDEQGTTAETDKSKGEGSDKSQLEQELEDAKQEMTDLEQADEVPTDPKDWPDGSAKFLTFDVDSDEPYGEGATAKLGPASLQHHEDGSVSIDGEKVDDPEKYKGEPIPGGPTDPNAAKLSGEEDKSKGGGDGDDAKDDDAPSAKGGQDDADDEAKSGGEKD